MEEESNHLLSIAVSSSEDESVVKVPRDFQSEKDFQHLLSTYSPKVDVGEIFQNLKLPLGSEATKQDLQVVMHAVEELYFLGRFEEAGQVVDSALEGKELSWKGVLADYVTVLEEYRRRCMERAGKQKREHLLG